MAWALAGGEEFMSVPILETLTSIFFFREAFKHYTLFTGVPYSLSYQNSTIGLNVAIVPTTGCLVTKQSPCLCVATPVKRTSCYANLITISLGKSQEDVVP